VLVGQATVTVSGKLAQFGSRLLVPVSDAMLAQFADNFRAAAAAVPMGAGAAGTAEAAAVAPEVLASPSAGAASSTVGDAPTAPSPVAAAPVRAPAAPVKELNALSLMWTVFKSWLAGLFGRKS
jgi:hypothetical protein